MADKSEKAEKPPGRPMRYPYTFTAKVAQFPFKFYIKNQWIWRYYFIAVACCIPVFYKISSMSNSEENKKAWAATKAREREEEEKKKH